METTSYESSSAVGAAFGAGFMIFWLLYMVFSIICTWKVFQKAGEEGWKCLIPIYNVIIMLKIVGKPWWWLLLFCIPFLNIVFGIWVMNLLSKSFGKSEGFTVGLIFLGPIFLAILAFDRTITYKGPAGNPSASLIDDVSNIGKGI
ncbi:DUF5684 domain-containing protein [Chitinophaga vietnamensis]|uniref:DUF5684 domain-containing protein n=1 Tax=Chitinophaga vietnamensis TaxID=2593957 RepID=UPI001F3A835E|nr:DUF5684 domain-containing protein [Chitinophaga vietnamensis]